MARFELATLCLQGRCNNHYATPAVVMIKVSEPFSKAIYSESQLSNDFHNGSSYYYIIRTSLKTNFGIKSTEPSVILRWKKSSPTGSWTRVSRVKAEYPDHLDYRGVHMLSTGIEPATLGLWDPRAANCATKALVSKVLSLKIKSDFLFLSRTKHTQVTVKLKFQLNVN